MATPSPGTQLTERQRIFCERWCVHQDGTKAWIESGERLGLKRNTTQAAAVRASKLLKMPHIQAYVNQIRGAAVLGASALKIDRETVASLEETLRTLTEQMRGTRPWRLRRSKWSRGGVVVEEAEQATAEPGLAASRLLDHFDGVGQPPDMSGIREIRERVLVVLGDVKARRQLDAIAAKAWKAPPVNGSGGNGKGG